MKRLVALWLLWCGCSGQNGPPCAEPDAPCTATAETAGWVMRAGNGLCLDGKPFRFLGANRYDLASFPKGSGKFVCGRAYSDAELDRLLEELVASTGATMLRSWAFQGFTDGAHDFSSLDRLIAASRTHGLKLILTIENEWPDCSVPDLASDDGRKSGAWYGGGYRAALDGQRLAYRDYVAALIARYRDEPTIAMWQLLNEAESTDGEALLEFVADVASLVKSIDGRHLVSLGTIGSGQPGTAGGAYRALHALATIDVLEAHDYTLPPDYAAATEPLPGAPDSTANSLFADLADAASLDKPFFVGEAGIPAPMPRYPFSREARAADLDAKIGANFAAGSDGFLVWSFYDLADDNVGGWDFDGSDPLAAAMRARALTQCTMR